MPVSYALTEKYYQVNGIQLHVIESGPTDGPVLLFLHGFPEFWYGWHKQIPYFAALGYRVVVPDQRGYNLSSKPESIRAYRIGELMKDIAELIGALDAGKVYLVGHDWGAIVAWNLATYYPQLLHRVVIINVPHPAVMRRTLRQSLDQLRRSWYIFFIQLPWLPEKLVSWGGFRMLQQTLQKTSLPGTFSEADLQQYKAAWSQPGSFTAMLNWYRAVRYERKPEALMPQQSGRITTPLLILWGEQDAFLRAEMAAKSLEKCANGRLILFTNATHWVHHEKHEEVNRAIESFIGEDTA